MKNLLVFLLLVLSFNISANNLQLGLIMGSPTGLSGKVELPNNRSVDFAMAYSLHDDLGFEIHADYLVEKARSLSLTGLVPMELFYGIGLRIVDIRKGKHDSDTAVGPRAPVGITMDINNPNLQFFAELALVLDIAPETNTDLDAGIGFRYRF
jgi:hypothetical protein